MSDSRIQKLLENDFERVSAKLENDGFSEIVLRKLSAHRSKRLAIVGAAGAAGAGFASAQFVKMTGVFAAVKPLVDSAAVAAAPIGFGGDVTYQLLAAATLAAAFAATFFILQTEI